LEKDLLHLEAKIPLPGVGGRIDHLAYDTAGRRLFVAALGNNTVEVVDLAGRKRLHSITGLHEPQGVQYLPSLGRLVVANGSDGTCVFYDSRTYAEVGRVALGDDADNIRYDGSRVYVGYGSGGIAVIDPVAMRKMGELPLKGHPESFQLADSGRVFINVPDAGEIVDADLGTLKVHGYWKNSGASANFPMALDRRDTRLFIAYRHPAQLRVLDGRTGVVEASASCVGDADDVFYDQASGLVFVSGGEGYLDVFRGAVLINHIATRRGAQTGLWLSGEKELVLAVPARSGEEAALWVYSMRDREK
jgi:DNA-binding beta-propeller fold protein YncE